MAEGGLFPWKVQSLHGQPSYVDFSPEAMQKRLPPLPAGFRWARLPDGEWTIAESGSHGAQVQGGDTENEPPVTALPPFLEHVIMPDDTLVGICLRYKVSKKELHQCNDFFGDHFRLCKVLRVPNKFCDARAVAGVLQPRSRDVDLQRFRYETGLGSKEAAFYLEANDYSVALALQQYRGDVAWEREHVDGAVTVTPVTASASAAARGFAAVRGLQPQRTTSGSGGSWYSNLQQGGSGGGGGGSRRPSRAAVSAVMAVTGTSSGDFSVLGQDGTIEMVPGNAEQLRVPLLGGYGR